MAAGKWNLVIEQGVTFTARFRIAVDGVPMQLTGRAIHAQIRSKTRNDLLLNLTPYMRVEPDGEAGVLDLYIPARVTRLLQRDGVWDLFIEDEGVRDSRGLRLLAGSVQLIKAVTNG